MADDLGFSQTGSAYAVTEADRAAIAAAIDTEELVKFALELGNIPSTSRREAQAAAFVYDWMEREGFSPWKVGATPSRPNVVGTYGGTGDGASLLFTAHLDTESPTYDPYLDSKALRPESLKNREWLECWLEDGVLRGYPIANDRGPMTCFLMAAKALKKAGYDLAGRLYLTACPGEIGPEPIEDWEGVEYLGKDIGANYLFHHGRVAPDYVIAAEGCDYGYTWIGCGYATFRIQVFGQSVFRPITKTPERTADHVSPIYRLGPLIEALHDWSLRYEAENRYDSPGGLSLPKATITSVQAGHPHAGGTEICSIYMSCDLNPRQTVNQVQRQLERVMRVQYGREFVVEPLVARHGYEANEAEVAPLISSVEHATQLTLGRPAGIASSVYSSMWRDHNVFNMQRIPAITTGFKRWRPSPQDFFDSTLIFALTSLAVCGRAENVESKKATSIYGSRENPFSDG
ncbi:MAG: peptidase M20 [Caulobacterales bacterium]